MLFKKRCWVFFLLEIQSHKIKENQFYGWEEHKKLYRYVNIDNSKRKYSIQ